MNHIDMESAGISLEQAEDVLNGFDECIRREMDEALKKTKDPYFHYFAEAYEHYRSLLFLSIDRIRKIAEDCKEGTPC